MSLGVGTLSCAFMCGEILGAETFYSSECFWFCYPSLRASFLLLLPFYSSQVRSPRSHASNAGIEDEHVATMRERIMQCRRAQVAMAQSVVGVCRGWCVPDIYILRRR